MKQPKLHTERIILRPFELSDAGVVQRLAGEFEIADTTILIPHPYEDGMAEEWISTHQPQFEAGEIANFAITLIESGDLIGAIGLVINQRHNHAEMGYWIGKPYWSKGYCTEAARAILEFGFTELSLHRIHAHYMTRNIASGKIMEKLGMTREGLMRQHIKKWDKFEDIILYGILKSDWELAGS
ncbi:MAG: GNAT family N-acetyltransferase [Candidatus Zixiibacteriota bacterium]